MVTTGSLYIAYWVFLPGVKQSNVTVNNSRPSCTHVKNGLLGVVRENSSFTLLALNTSTQKMEAALSLETPAT